jgi:hypothetical protein
MLQRRPHWRLLPASELYVRPMRLVFLKPAIWWRITSAIVAVLLFAATPLALLFAASCLAHAGPGGQSTYPYTVSEIVEGVFFLLFPLFGLFFTWLALGAPVIRRSLDSGVRKLLDRADRLERKGRVEEAIELYQQIAADYSNTPPGQYAQASIKSLRGEI